MLKELVGRCALVCAIASIASAASTAYANDPSNQASSMMSNSTAANGSTKAVTSSGTTPSTSKEAGKNSSNSGANTTDAAKNSSNKIDAMSSVSANKAPAPRAAAATTSATATSTALPTPPADSNEGRKHKRTHYKRNKGEIVDGEPLGTIGEHKKVDGGFDFENSQDFNKSQQP